MRVAQVVGKVTLARAHPSLAQARLRMVIPLDLAQIAAGPPVDPWAGDCDEVIVAWDHCSAGGDGWVALAEGPEAAQPFYPELKPVDAGVVALLDQVEVDGRMLERLTAVSP